MTMVSRCLKYSGFEGLDHFRLGWWTIIDDPWGKRKNCQWSFRSSLVFSRSSARILSRRAHSFNSKQQILIEPVRLVTNDLRTCGLIPLAVHENYGNPPPGDDRRNLRLSERQSTRAPTVMSSLNANSDNFRSLTFVTLVFITFVTHLDGKTKTVVILSMI